MPAVRSAKASTVRRDSGQHTIVAWDDISSTSSDSSSSSDSSLPTPPQSPRPARRRLTRKKKSANGPVSFASHVSLPSGSDISVECAQPWFERPFETDHRLFRRSEAEEGWMTDSLMVDLTGENPMMEKSVEQEFSYFVDDISEFFQSLQCDGPSGRKATSAEEFPRTPYPSGLEDHDLCFPPTPETPFMATVPLPYESYANQYFENSVFVASSHIGDEFITDNPDLTSSSFHASHAQVSDNLLGLSLF